MKNTFDLRPEQWVLLGALLFLGIISTIKALGLPDLDAGLRGGKEKQPDPFDTAPLEDLKERWDNPPQIIPTEHHVFISRLIVYEPGTGKIGYRGPEEKGPDGIPLSWKEKYGFSFQDPTVADSDPDQDGFTTFEEYQAGTHPKDVDSHPPFVQKLCVSDYEYIPFRLEFKGYSRAATGGGMIYQINLLDAVRRKSRMMREGLDLEGYIIRDFRKKIVEELVGTTGKVMRVDKSELDIYNPVLDETITLVFNQEMESDESRVKLKLKVPGKSPEPSDLRRGEKFTIEDETFQLVTAKADQAVIKNLKTGESITVRACRSSTE